MSIMVMGPGARPVLRQAFNQLRWAPLLPMLIAEAEQPNAGRAERVSTFLLCCAAPQIAGYLLELEHAGRLDQLRLSGRTPFRIALQVAAAGSPWIIGGLALLAWSIVIDGRLVAPAVTAALIGAPTALAAISTTTVFRRQRIDPRIVIVGLGFIGASLGIAGGMQFWTTSGRVPAATALYAVVVEGVVTALCLRGLLRRIAYPPASAAKTSTAFDYRPEFLMRVPSMYRGAVLAASGFVLAIVFPPVIAIVRGLVGDPDAISITPFLLSPIVIGGIAISLICREDAVLGRLDVVRLSAITPSTAALQMIAGLWLPFVLSSVSLAIVASTMFTIDPLELALIVAGLLVVAPLPIVEGWSRLWPMTFMVPYVVAMALPLRLGALAPGIALFALLWWSAIRRFNDSDRPVLSGWAGTAATATLGAAPWSMVASGYIPEPAMLASAAALIAASPLLEADAFGRHRDFWIRLSSIMAATTVATASGLGWRDGVAAAIATALIWIASLRVRQSQVLSSARQGVVRVGGVILVAVVVAAPPRESVVGGSIFESFAVAALGLLIAVEAALRAAAFVKRRATPRP